MTALLEARPASVVAWQFTVVHQQHAGSMLQQRFKPPDFSVQQTLRSHFHRTPIFKPTGATLMRLMSINNDGAGFADDIDVEAGITVATLFERQIPQGKPEDYLIRVNRQPVTSDTVLQEGDRLSITPRKIEGA